MLDLHDSLRTKPLFLATLVVSALHVACSDGSSPTAPAAPTSPSPQADLRTEVLKASYTLLVAPVSESSGYPHAGELLVDGEAFWAGPMGPPGFCNSCYFYDLPPANLAYESSREMSLGSHVLGFRVTDQSRSPTEYLLSGWIDVEYLVFNGNIAVSDRTQRVLHFQDVQARLGTGEVWSIPFDIPVATL